MLLTIEKWIDRFTDMIGGIATVAMFLMMLNVFYDAIMRYVFDSSSIAMQEMEWHLFSVVFLLGIAYALKSDGHVRVDILYDRWSPKTQAIINIVGTLLLMLPLSFLIVEGSAWFVHEAYISGEISADPGGLTHRWLIKAIIPVSFVFLIISAVSFMIRNFNIYRDIEAPKPHAIEDDIL